MSFTNVFGGSTLQASDVAYRAFTFGVNTTLAWPPLSTDPTTLAARTMDVTASAAGLALTLPPANQVSTGYDLLITNRGVNSFSVVNNSGAAIVTIAAGQSKYVQVIDNTSTGGSWNVVNFGVGTSSVDAASLVGPGIGASGPALYASEPTVTFSANYTIVSSDRAKVYVWTGGSGTQSLPAAGAVGTEFFYAVRNQGTGALTIAANGGELVDGASTITLQPTESAELHAGVGNWYTVGRGRSVQFSFTLLVKAITGGTVTLTSTEASNVVQRYTGALVSNANIVLPSVVQVYYVSNQTSGAFTVTFKTSGGGSAISVPANQNAVLFCDGLNISNASTTVSGLTGLILAQGSQSAPSIAYSGDTSTGVFQPTSGQVAVSISGTQTATFSSTGLALTGAISGTTGSFSGLITASTAPTLPAHLANKAYVDSVVGGGGFLPLTAGSGNPLTGVLYTSSAAAEGHRLQNSGAFFSGYDSAGTTRTGYLQFNASGQVILAADTGATGGVALSTAGSVRLSINNSGASTFSGTVTGTSFNGKLATANISQWTNDSGYLTSAAAGSLTGTTLAAGVTASSLTSFGASIALGTPASGNLANCTFPTLNQNTTGTSSNITAFTINQNVGTGNSPSFVDVTITSDESVKANWRPFEPDILNRFARVKRGIYDRKDAALTQAGVSANSFEKILSVGVVRGEDGLRRISQSVTLALLAEVTAVVLAQGLRIDELEATR